MRGLESWLNGIWYGGKKPPVTLKALAGLYGLLLQCRKPVSTDSLGAPVIIVGNFTAGGTGKTPLIIALVARLMASGFRPGVVSRGYGRKSKQPSSVDAASNPDDGGDEPVLIAKRTQAPIRVDVDRRRAARHLIAQGRTKHPKLEFVEADAMALPFGDNEFDAVTISFGLRNIVDPHQALAEFYRVLVPGGRVVVCEFSSPPLSIVRAGYLG